MIWRNQCRIQSQYLENRRYYRFYFILFLNVVREQKKKTFFSKLVFHTRHWLVPRTTTLLLRLIELKFLPQIPWRFGPEVKSAVFDLDLSIQICRILKDETPSWPSTFNVFLLSKKKKVRFSKKLKNYL